MCPGTYSLRAIFNSLSLTDKLFYARFEYCLAQCILFLELRKFYLIIYADSDILESFLLTVSSSRKYTADCIAI